MCVAAVECAANNDRANCKLCHNLSWYKEGYKEKWILLCWFSYMSRTYVLQIVGDPEDAQEHFTVTEMHQLLSWKWQHGKTLAVTEIHQTKSACRSSSSRHCLNWNLVQRSHLVICILAEKNHYEEFNAPKESRLPVNFYPKINASNRGVNWWTGTC